MSALNAPLAARSNSIYFNEPNHFDEPRVPQAPQKIGALWADMRDSFQVDPCSERTKSLMERLGVDKTDKEAHVLILPMLEQAFGPGVRITPSEENTGVYFLSRGGKKFAVFKVGEKRARMEILVRHIAHRLGLEKHAVPGIFCTLKEPKLPEDEIIVELWNGHQKVIDSDTDAFEDGFTLTGILEPYVKLDTEITVAEMAKMTVLALAVGLRDAKSDGMAGSMLLDTEDCMPSRFLPDTSPNKKVAATYLPYLENPKANEFIPKQVLEGFAKMVEDDAWSIEGLLADLSSQRVDFADRSSEDLIPIDKELYKKGAPRRDYGWDHGGCYVQVEQAKQILDEHTTIDVSKTSQLLSRSQKEALVGRITRLRDFLGNAIASDEQVTTLDMVRAVDPLFNAHMKALERAQNYYTHLKLKAVGRVSPKDSQTQLNPDEVREVLNPSPPSLYRGSSGGFNGRQLFFGDEASLTPPPSSFGTKSELQTLLAQSKFT